MKLYGKLDPVYGNLCQISSQPFEEDCVYVDLDKCSAPRIDLSLEDWKPYNCSMDYEIEDLEKYGDTLIEFLKEHDLLKRFGLEFRVYWKVGQITNCILYYGDNHRMYVDLKLADIILKENFIK